MGNEFPIAEDVKPSLKDPIFNHLKVRQTLSSWIKDIQKIGFLYTNEIEVEEEDSDSEFDDDPDLIGDPYSEIEDDDIKEIEDGKERLKGQCSVILKNGDIVSGRFQGTKLPPKRVGKGGGFTPSQSKTLSCIWGGIYDYNGRLSGYGKAQLLDDTCLEGYFQEGYLHGLVRGRKVGRSNLVWIGRYYYGKPKGLCWKFTEGGGAIVGHVNETDGSFTGDNIAYIYPDLLTCILGKFKNGVLIQGQASTICGLSINASTRELNEIYFNPVKPDAPIYSYWPSDLYSIPCPRLLRDPYETSIAFLAKSKISEFAGDGLFAFRDVTAGETVAFYNGLRIRIGEKPKVESDSYQVYIDWDLAKIPKSDYMDIPPGYECSKKYQASFGHKINHSFNPNCGWDTIQHPCFGRIPKLVALTDISEGEEFTCHYRIDMEQANLIPSLEWYVNAWDEFTPPINDHD
uniref:SET domain containing (Lysine methyltransferase) 7 [Danio rerio] n=1 Tax=Lepeophtheirus salmonis TaxID=72036 RepID=A0A0K2UF62_LEPSM